MSSDPAGSGSGDPAGSGSSDSAGIGSGDPAPARAAGTGTARRQAPASVGFLGAVWLVAEREVVVRLQDRGFLISTLVTVLLVAGGFTVPLVVDGGPARYEVATVGTDASRAVAEVTERAEAADQPAGAGGLAAAPGLAALGDFTVTAREASDVAAAEQLVLAGEVDVAVVSVPDGGAGAVELVGETGVPGDLAAAVAVAAQDLSVRERLAGEALSPEAVTAALAPSSVAERLLDPSATDSTTALVVGLAFALVFFFTVFSYGYTIAQSVTEEKQSRVVELLVAAVPIRALLVGKVLGNLVLALGQLVLLVAVGLATASAVGQGGVIPLLTANAGWFLLFFLLGFAMLACLWAATGALANRQEDLGSTTLPVQLLVFVPFFTAFTVTGEGPWRVALSYVPFTAPVIMPQRLLVGEASWLAALGAIAAILATGVVLVLVAERLYRGSLLRTRGQTDLRQAWASAED